MEFFLTILGVAIFCTAAGFLMGRVYGEAKVFTLCFETYKEIINDLEIVQDEGDRRRLREAFSELTRKRTDGSSEDS